MTTVFFLRHAESTANEKGVLAGRTPGVELSDRGAKQAKKLTSYLSDFDFDVIISSPLERCLQTVAPYLDKTSKELHELSEFQEMDYGSWSGRELNVLAKKREWQIIQKTPEEFGFPRGESFKAAARRVRKGLSAIQRDYPDKRILIVSHGDIIKIAVTVSLALPLKNFQKLIIDPGSLTSINLSQGKLLFLNQKANLKSKVSQLGNRLMLGGGTDR